MAQKQPDYLAYLLRLWRAKEKEAVVWRASLEAADTHERTGFANLAKLIEFLQEQMGAPLKPTEVIENNQSEGVTSANDEV